MAALVAGDFIGTADVNDIIPTEAIQMVVEGFNLPNNIAKAGSVCAGAAVISAVAGEPQMEAATRALVGALADARPSAP